jgi:hypothetical protein
MEGLYSGNYGAGKQLPGVLSAALISFTGNQSAQKKLSQT